MRHQNAIVQDIDALRTALNEMHRNTGSWREVGLALGKSGAYAQRVARGDLMPSQEAVLSWHYFETGEQQHVVIMDDAEYAAYVAWKEGNA